MNSPLWIVMALLSALLWAGASLVDKLAVNFGFRTLEVLPATYTAGFIVVAWKHQWNAELWQLEHILSGAFLAFFSMLNAFALLRALRIGDVGLVSIVAGSHCVITAIVATLVLGEQVSYRQWIAIALAVVGLVLVLGVGPDGKPRQRDKQHGYRWFWLALLAAIGSSGETIGIKLATNLSEGAQLALLWEYFIASLVLLGMVATYKVRPQVRSTTFGLMDGVLTGLGMLTFGMALSMGPASLVAMVATAAVLFRAIGGIIFFGDRAGRRQWVGFCVLLVSFVLVRF